MARSYMWHQTIAHTGLNKSRTIKADSRGELNYKCELQYAQWNEQWQRKLEIENRRKIVEQKRQEKAKIARNNEIAIEYAKNQTIEAEENQRDIENILIDSIEVKIIDFEDLKDKSKFNVKAPQKPNYINSTREPERTDLKYNPKPGILLKLFKKKREQFNIDNNNRFVMDHDEWEKSEKQRIVNNSELDKKYNECFDRWKVEEAEFYKKQAEKNQGIDEFKKSVGNCNASSVVELFGMISNNIKLPIDFEFDYDAEYIEENKNFILDVIFPCIDDIPNLKSVSYVKSKQEFKESFFTEKQMQKKYDDFCYKLVLIILNYVFCINNYGNIIEAVTLNGIINTIDRTTGNNMSVCIISVRSNFYDFSKLNLELIDPKAWFRSSKGIAAASIANITPVQPIQRLNKEDDRIIEGYGVIDSLEEGVNLASIDWRDFENLIREVFEQVFSSTGGEVKVTQASRDGGVDAIVFDPDPIRGGKVIIQAKRYTNVVGVSAVRDLYGTLMNEGAMKGILVTTSYFGNDAYEFANGKPLQLIDGAQLLGLLEESGYKARINLKEAKTINKKSNN